MFGLGRSHRARQEELQRREQQQREAYEAQYRRVSGRIEPEPPHNPPPPAPVEHHSTGAVVVGGLMDTFTSIRDTYDTFMGTFMVSPPSVGTDYYRVIENFLRGGDSVGAGLRSYDQSNGNRYLTTTFGGYHLIRWDKDHDPWLNLSRGLYVSAPTETEMRDNAVRVFEALSIPFIPIAEASVPHLGVGTRKLVHRQGLECVLRVDQTIPGVKMSPRYYLSGYDTQENPPLYFLCRLPHAVQTVDEAREALKPQSVKHAEAEGITVKRQGDLFAIKSSFTQESLRAAGAKLFPSPEIGEKIDLYGTSHRADRTAVMPNGMMLASGKLIHDPYGTLGPRTPDHHECVLDDGWWFIAKNTVPVSGDGRTVIPDNRPDTRPNRSRDYRPVSAATPAPAALTYATGVRLVDPSGTTMPVFTDGTGNPLQVREIRMVNDRLTTRYEATLVSPDGTGIMVQLPLEIGAHLAATVSRG